MNQMSKIKYEKVVCTALVILTSIAPNTSWALHASDGVKNDEVVVQNVSEKTEKNEPAEQIEQPEETVEETVLPTSISFNQTAWNASIGQTFQLRVIPTSTTKNWDAFQNIVWQSDNDEIAEVDNEGNVTTKSKGQANIIATVNGTDVQASCLVTVSDQKEIYPSYIDLNASKETLDQGKTFQLKVNGYSSNATTKEVTWSTSDEHVATVDEKGLVTAKEAGTVTITATSVGIAPNQTEPAKATCTFTVRGVEGNYIYTLKDDSVEISQYTGKEANVRIPSTLGGKPVTSLATYSFWLNDDMTSVVVPEGVTKFGKEVFSGNDNLVSVTLPSTLKDLGTSTFRNTAIQEIVIPEGITKLGSDLFNNCDQLRKVTLPNSLTSIGSNAFYNCKSLKELVLPDNIESVSPKAFTGMTGTIKANTGSKTAEALKASGISFEESKKEIYPSYIDLNASKETLDQGKTFQLKVNGYSSNATTKEVTWSTSDEHVATVDEKGLVTAKEAGTVTITATSVGIAPNQTEPAKATCTFTVRGVEGNYIYTLKDDSVEISQYTGKEANVRIPSTLGGKPVTSLATYSFWLNDDMTSVVVPEGVTKFGKEVFSGNDNLVSVTLPSTLKDLGTSTFRNTAIQEIVIPEGITKLGSDLFNNCDQLRKVTLPNSLTSIGSNAFYNCKSLKELVLPDNIESVSPKAFTGMTGTIYVHKGSVTETTLKNGKIPFKYYQNDEVVNIAPVIHAKDATLTVGDSFDALKDVTATDVEDGDLTKEIKVIVNTVDTKKAGTYKVGYEVTDSQGAKTTKYVTVIVKDKAMTTPSDKKDPDKSNGTNTGVTTGLFASILGMTTAGAAVLELLKKRKK